MQQPSPEGPCLRFPDNLGVHRELTYEMAVNMLLRATQLAQTVPFTWSYLDKPADGSVTLLFLAQPHIFPNDGIRYQEQESKFSMPVGSGRELEVAEVKFGFIPGGQDSMAYRIRRRYRLTKGGHPQLILVHYSQGPQTPIVPAMNTPIRQYPLRPINEPPVYVAGDKMGQKAFPPGMSTMPSGGPQIQQQPGMPMNLQHQQQHMIAQQNNNMDMLERRRAEERAAAAARGRGPTTAAGRGPHPPEEDSGDEHEQISTRTLALNRYKRNHELMNEVFHHAAFHDKNASPPPKPYSIFNKDELDEKTRKLEEEIEALKTKKLERRPVPTASTDITDVSMSDGIAV